MSDPVKTDGGFLGLLVNIHDCAFSCEGYPAHVAWMGVEVPHGDLTLLDGLTWSGVVLGLLGLMMILLGVTGIITWWPGRKRISHGFRVRWGRGRFARDYDLHNVVGVVGLPFVLLWGLTGAAFELPPVETAWLAVTGGSTAPEPEFSLEPVAHTATDPTVTLAQATAAAVAAVPGQATWVGRPSEETPFYEIDITTGWNASTHRAIYRGDAYVLVDPWDVTHTQVIGADTGPLSNRLYDKVLEPSHFGWNVNAWWRIVWFVMGLTPLVLMVTGVSTWLYRRQARRRRRQSARLGVTPPAASV